MENAENPNATKAQAALDTLAESCAYFDAEPEVVCETPEYAEYLIAA